MTDYLTRAQGIAPQIAALRRDFHRHPELGNREYRTAERIEACLNGWGIPTRRLLDTAVVARLEGGAWRALNLGGAALANETRLAVTPGLYRVTATAREIDGGCVGVMRTVAVEGGGEAVVRLSLPETHTADKLLRAPLPPLAVRVDGKPAALPAALSGRPGIVAVIAPGQEPTEHFLNELIDARALLAERRIRVWLLTEDAARADNAKLARALESVKDASLAFSPDPEALREWRARLNARELRLPLAVAIGRGGTGLFAFVNYNVGSVAALIDVVEGE